MCKINISTASGNLLLDFKTEMDFDSEEATSRRDCHKFTKLSCLVFRHLGLYHVTRKFGIPLVADILMRLLLFQDRPNCRHFWKSDLRSQALRCRSIEVSIWVNLTPLERMSNEHRAACKTITNSRSYIFVSEWITFAILNKSYLFVANP